MVKAAADQMSALGHVSNIYLHSKLYEYTEKILEKMPGNLKVVLFVNSGSEANDLATLLAREYTKNYDIISLTNGYHGMTYQTMGLTANSAYKHYVPYASGFHHVRNINIISCLKIYCLTVNILFDCEYIYCLTDNILFD